ncbi:hypothetical protein WJX82_010273 [Trebouxia sp. C0006]
MLVQRERVWVEKQKKSVCVYTRMSGSADPSWAQQDKRRVLVIDIRVRNIEHTQQFYEQHLGMRLWRRLGDLQQGQFTSVCGYGPEQTNASLHFHNDEQRSPVHLGKAFGHFSCSHPGLRIAKLIEDMQLTGTGRVSKVEEFEVANVESLRLGRDADKIACVVDPAGYYWEVLERHERNVSEALCKVMLRVSGDLDTHIKFYHEVLGMRLIRKAHLAPGHHECAYMSYNPSERDGTWIELLLSDPAQVNDKGDGFQFIAISTKNVFQTAESIRKANAPILQDVGHFPGTSITSVVTQDPSGWKYVFFNEDDYQRDVESRQHVH